jgi:hypothetical protein
MASASASSAVAKTLLSPMQVMSMLKASPEPEALAVQLVEAASSTASEYNPVCNNSASGYDHCMNCALPTISELADQLVIIKSEIWTAQKARAASATTTCTAAYPADRIGGDSKCCSGSGTISYAPFAYTRCQASTFGVAHTGALTESALLRTDDKGFYIEPATVTSKITIECCSADSTCRTNTNKYNAALKAKMNSMNAHWALKVKDRDEKNAATAKFQAVTVAHASRKVTLLNLCRDPDSSASGGLGDPAVADPISATLLAARPASVALARSTCKEPSHIAEVSVREANRANDLHDNLQSVQRAIDVIKQVKSWLDINAGEIFANNHQAEDGSTIVEPVVDTYTPATMVALLESAQSQKSHSPVATEALKKTMQLVEAHKADTHDSAAVTAVINLLDEVIAKLEASKAQTTTYEAQMVQDEATEIASLYANMHAVWGEYITDVTTLSGLQEQATNYEDPETDTMLDNYKTEWVADWNLREQNARQCMEFMTYYDSETLTNTGELLILKKAIDIIKNIGCGPNNLATISPTEAVVVPTLAPTPAPTPRCQNSDDVTQTALFAQTVVGANGDVECTWSGAVAGVTTKRQCQVHCLQITYTGPNDTNHECFAMRFDGSKCETTETRNCDLYAAALTTGESLQSRDCFDIQQGGELGTVNAPAAGYYPVCDAADMRTVVTTAGTLVANTYRVMAANFACNEASEKGTVVADRTIAECKALCDADATCAAFETTVDTHTHIDVDTGVEHIAGACDLYTTVNNYVDVVTVAGNRQCHVRYDSPTVGVGTFVKEATNEYKLTDTGSSPAIDYYMYKGDADGRWRIAPSTSAANDDVFYWGPDSASIHQDTEGATVDGPPPADRWTAGNGASGTVPPSQLTCAARMAPCLGGTYRFMAKASQLGSTYEVPANYVANPITATVDAGVAIDYVIGSAGVQMLDGVCSTIDSPVAHSQLYDAQLTHQYKCCDGQMYGAIATMSGDQSEASTVDLCDETPASASQCSVFGANMYLVTGDADEDPSTTCAANQHYSAASDGCAANVCTCPTGLLGDATGTVVADAQCTRHGNEQCGSCPSSPGFTTGYHRTYINAAGVSEATVHEHDTQSIPCILNTCVCTDGVPTLESDAGGTCNAEGTTNSCSECSAGFTLVAGQCVLDTCKCQDAGASFAIGVAATGTACDTGVNAATGQSDTQKCMSCNTGYVHDAAAFSCTATTPCAASINHCNQVQTANTCAATSGVNPVVTCTCDAAGGYSTESNCHKCVGGKAGRFCDISCTNMDNSAAGSFTFTPSLDTESTNAATCAFACASGFTYNAATAACE